MNNLGKDNTQERPVKPKENKQLSKKSSWNEMRLEIGLSAHKFWKYIGFENKTMWDWLKLIIAGAVPVVVAYYGQQIQIQAQTIANDEKHQEILSSYLEDITELLLEKNLRQSATDSEVQMVARIKTLNTVRRLDGESKGQLLKFLYEADLIGKCQIDRNRLIVLDKNKDCQQAILHFKNASLDRTSVPSAILFPGIDLRGAELSQAFLVGTDLTNAQLQEANLKEASLDRALLNDADLTSAILINANLLYTQLFRVHLSSAALDGANL